MGVSLELGACKHTNTSENRNPYIGELQDFWKHNYELLRILKLAAKLHTAKLHLTKNVHKSVGC